MAPTPESYIFVVPSGTRRENPGGEIRRGRRDDHAPARLEVIVSAGSSGPVRDALVLAAGNGDRFNNGSRQSKLLEPILGQPLIIRTLLGAHAAGADSVELVLGYQAERVRATIEAATLPGLRVHFSYNPDWHLENGLSALAARTRFAHSRFALLMGDHLFDPAVLAKLLTTDAGPNESLLAVDSRPAPKAVVAEATKVWMHGERIEAIGKDLIRYNALDTGMFVCSPDIFDAIETARACGDTTLSGGIRSLARRGLMRGVDIGDAAWYDIDTLSDLQHAERLLIETTSARAETL